jgi:deoxyribodipyrimidine photo-lyase
MRHVWSAIHLAQEPGAQLGGDEVLQRRMPALRAQRRAPGGGRPMSAPLRRSFADRADLVAYVREQFPEAAARDATVSPIRGGQRAARERLARLNPVRYAATRNALDGAVTGLSPYLRHGVIGLAEVRDAALAAVRRAADAGKLINELGWRDYWQRVYRQIGRGIWRDREPLKTGWPASAYAATLPDDVAQGTTGLACIDAFSQQLRDTGYLHNHARLWLAAYLVHWRRVRWQAGARWFLEHLLDGDPASNNLSWQWVASSFSSKPYWFDRDNLERLSGGRFCRGCPRAGDCPFAGDRAVLYRRLFPQLPPEAPR